MPSTSAPCESRVEIDARYSDGKSAASRAVRVHLTDHHLAILGTDGAAIAAWLIADMRLIDDLAKGAAARLSPGPDRDERLSLTSAAFIAELSRRNRDLRRSAYGRGREWKMVLWWSAGAVVSLVVLFTVLLPLFARQIAAIIPVGIEQSAGRWISALIIAQMGRDGGKGTGPALCEKPEGVAALDKLARHLAVATPPRLALTVRVINTKMVNALALPGGQILIFRGLIDKAASPNAVAGVLAHEIGHVDLRHSTEVAIQQTTTGVVVGMLVGDVAGFSALGSLATTLIGSRYTRDAESAADAHAVAMMRAAGFAANPFAVFMEQMESPSGGPLDALSYLSSHPPSPERAAHIRAGGAEGKEALTQAEWMALKTICGTPASD